jgi:hypothetical protein
MKQETLQQVERLTDFDTMKLLIELNFYNRPAIMKPKLTELNTSGAYTDRLTKQFSKLTGLTLFETEQLLKLSLDLLQWECITALDGLGGSKARDITTIIIEYTDALKRGF